MCYLRNTDTGETCPSSNLNITLVTAEPEGLLWQVHCRFAAADDGFRDLFISLMTVASSICDADAPEEDLRIFYEQNITPSEEGFRSGSYYEVPATVQHSVYNDPYEGMITGFIENITLADPSETSATPRDWDYFSGKFNERMVQLGIPLEMDALKGSREDICLQFLLRRTDTGELCTAEKGLAFHAAIHTQRREWEEMTFTLTPGVSTELEAWFPQIVAAAGALSSNDLTEEDILDFYAREPERVDSDWTYSSFRNKTKSIVYSLNTSQTTKQIIYSMRGNLGPQDKLPLEIVTCEEFLSRLNREIAGLGIPLEFRLDAPFGSESTQELVIHNTELDRDYQTNGGYTASVEIRIRDRAVTKFYFSRDSKVIQRRAEQESGMHYEYLVDYFPQICAIASSICDSNLPREDALAFHSQEPSETGSGYERYIYAPVDSRVHHEIYYNTNTSYRIEYTGYMIRLEPDSLPAVTTGNPFATLGIQEGPSVQDGKFAFDVWKSLSYLEDYFKAQNLTVYFTASTSDDFPNWAPRCSFHPIGTRDTDQYGMRIYFYSYNDPADPFIDVYYTLTADELAGAADLAALFEDPNHILHAPMALSLLCDSGLTLEEILPFFTHQMEPDRLLADGRTVTLYCPRDTVHILLSDPETGEDVYYVTTTARFQARFRSDLGRMFP